MEMDFSPEKRNERARSEFKERAGHHTEDLFDQDEDAAGEKVNLATGKPIENSKSRLPDDIRVREVAQEGDIMGPVEKDEDEAEKWLRKNDPNYGTGASLQ